MKKYLVKFFLMMQGMDSPSKDYWEVSATSKEDAIQKIIKREFNGDDSFVKSCLSAIEVK